MSQTKDPVTDVETRSEKAEQVDILDVREIDGSTFDLPDKQTVYELDLINERGESRENVVVIPGILFENTKDVQYRHEDGICGKYTLALARENEDAKQELIEGVRDKRTEVKEEIKTLREKDSRLLHVLANLDGL